MGRVRGREPLLRHRGAGTIATTARLEAVRVSRILAWARRSRAAPYPPQPPEAGRVGGAAQDRRPNLAADRWRPQSLGTGPTRRRLARCGDANPPTPTHTHPTPT